MPQTIDFPFIESGEVYGATPALPRTITFPFIESGVVHAPVVTLATTPTVELLVGGTVVDGAFARSFEERLADKGQFSFSMLRTDFATSGIAMGDDVVFRLDGVARFRGFVGKLAHVAVAQGEEAAQIVTVSGDGALGKLAQHVVYPSRGVGALPIEDVRTYSWVGADFQPAAAGWLPPKIVNSQQSYADTDAPRPPIWPDVTARWIAPNLPSVTAFDAPEGITLYRKNVTMAETRMTRHFFAADAICRPYLDGEEVDGAFTLARSIEREWSAGEHDVAVKVANETDTPGVNNPTGLLACGWTLTSDGLLDELIYETNTTWRCLPYPVRAPGFTVGKVLRLLFAEAGIDGDWTLDFTDHVDTAGQPWTYQREITLNVGRTLLEAVRELMDVHADIACAPGSQTLRAWNRGTRGRPTSVVLEHDDDEATSDFLALSHTGNDARAAKYLVRFDGGHVEEGSGSPVGYIEAGHIKDEEIAREYAAARIEVLGEPAYSTTATLAPRSSATTPYAAFELGDSVTCPDENDDPVSTRVASITWDEDDDGEVTWPITLRDLRLEVDEAQQIGLARMAMGTGVGGARIGSRAATPAPSAQLVSILKVAEFSIDGPLDDAESPYSLIRPAEQSGNVVQVVVEITDPDAMTGDAEIEVRYGTTADISGRVLTGTLLASVTVAQGEREGSAPVAAVPVIANRTKLQAQIVDGGGATGLGVQVRAI